MRRGCTADDIEDADDSDARLEGEVRAPVELDRDPIRRYPCRYPCRHKSLVIQDVGL